MLSEKEKLEMINKDRSPNTQISKDQWLIQNDYKNLRDKAAGSSAQAHHQGFSEIGQGDDRSGQMPDIPISSLVTGITHKDKVFKEREKQFK